MATTHKPVTESDSKVMHMTDPELYRFLKFLPPVARDKFAASTTGAFSERTSAMLHKYEMEKVHEVNEIMIVGERDTPTESPAEAAQRRDPVAVDGYYYKNESVIGSTDQCGTPEQAMKMLQADPNRFFPFDVVPLTGTDKQLSDARSLIESSKWDELKPALGQLTKEPTEGGRIQEGGIYDLQNPRLIAPGVDKGNYVTVKSVTPTAFTFRTLPGHFDGPGALISFATFEKDGKVFLQQTGYAPHVGLVKSIINPIGAREVAWKIQAARLEAALARRESAVCPPENTPPHTLSDRGLGGMENGR